VNDDPWTEQQPAYRAIFKATSLFGGVQVFNILIAIVRSKIVAVLLGPAGMGIAGLLTSTTSLIGGLTNFGLGVSAVKNVAAADASGDPVRVATVVGVLRRLVWITGLLGAVVTLVLSPWLSQLTFGNRDYTVAFIWISVTLLFSQLSSGQMVILQGMRKLRYLAQANMAGAVLGLVISAPIYYFWGVDGIVPAIIASSLLALALSWYFAHKVSSQKMKVDGRTTFVEGRDMLRMGIMLSLQSLIAMGAAYIVHMFISNTGGVEQVGLYKAGFTIITTYVGMVFTAMSTDYYPRLSKVARDDEQARKLINQQIEVATLILAPILTILIIFINWILPLLYSEKFLAVNEMIHWAALGMYFRAVSWAIAFILLAKGASRLYFWNELAASLYILALNLVGYRLAGLEGMGISFLIGYVIYLLQIYIVARRRYSFHFDKTFYRLFGLHLLLGSLCFADIKLLTAPWIYLIGIPLILVSGFYSLYELEGRLGLGSIVGLCFRKTVILCQRKREKREIAADQRDHSSL